MGRIIFGLLVLVAMSQGCGVGGFESDELASKQSNTTDTSSTYPSSPLAPTGGDSTFTNSPESQPPGNSAAPASTASSSSPELSGVSCDDAQIELPVATHWDTATGRREGASDQIAIQNPAGVVDHRFYNYLFLPEFNKYIGTNYSVSQWPDSEVRSWARARCIGTGIAVEFRKPQSYSNWGLSKIAARTGRRSIQILPALTTPNSMVTIVLPPGWEQSAPKGTYAIMFEGSYDVNDNLRDSGTTMVRAIASVWKSGYKVIGVTWNGGGSMASRTMNEQALSEFNQIIQQVGENFGGDPDRIVMYGTSRGGSTALRMAANPHKFPYKVVAAFANVPPASPGSIVQLTGATIPALLDAAEWTIGINNTWTANWLYPRFEFGANSLTGLNRNQAHLKILTGTSDPAVADQSLSSLSSASILTALKNSGTTVYLQISSHDYIVPWVDQLHFSRRLSEYSIPHELRVNFLAGHYGSTIETRLTSSVLAVASGAPISSSITVGSKTYHRVNSATGVLERMNGPVFTLEIPRYISPSVGGHLIATGMPGTQVRIAGVANGVTFQEAGTLQSHGVWIWDLSGLAPKRYIVQSVKILKPGQTDWLTLSLARSTSRQNLNQLEVEVLAADPTGSANQLLISILAGYLGVNREYATAPFFTNVTYGISE
ncbi:MAG: hypothetical protein NDI61_04200 [Bdellovibrionaceae bacterium]|nr:hypothetical protein [Pseudobdellovibrionaceae bacterium]